MKVLYDGTSRIKKCKYCKSIFKYNEDDIEADDEFGYIFYLYVECPICGAEIQI